jgi:hypothetical protein
MAYVNEMHKRFSENIAAMRAHRQARAAAESAAEKARQEAAEIATH